MKTKLKFLTLITFFSMLTANAFSQVQNSSCPTDVNADGITTSGDASLVSAQLGSSCPGGGSPCPTDVNHDGITSNADLGLVLVKVSTRCNVGVFDVSNATYGSGYVDVPVYISSDNTITSLDFSFNFNETKLTFSTINTITSYPAFSPSFYFHPVDRKLRMTSYTTSHFDNDLTLVSIRFTIGTGVTALPSDFSNVAVYLNGNTTGFIMR